MSENNYSFKLSAEEVSRFVNSPGSIMYDQEGVVCAFMTDPEVIARILPPPLKPFSAPIATFSLCHVKNPNFTEPYYEAVLGVYAVLGDKVGSYPLSLILDGKGAEMGQLIGREKAAWPKKTGAQFTLNNDGETITATLCRNGVQLANLKVKLGEYNNNNPLMGQLYKNPGPGVVTSGTGYCYKFGYTPDENSKLVFGTCSVIGNVCEYHYKDWKPGTAELTLNSGKDDPWGELPVKAVIGGAYTYSDLHLPACYHMADVDINEALPYVLTARYDRTLLHGERFDM